MKKMQVLGISCLFLINLTTNNIYASPLDFIKSPYPYAFGPQGRTISDLRNFATPVKMVSILPNMPVASTSQDRTTKYYSSTGKQIASVSNGVISYTFGGVTKKYSNTGKLVSITRTLEGLLQETRNDKNEVIGYTLLNGNGKVSRTYDKDKNLTAIYHYTDQGTRLDYVQDAMTNGRTYYDKYERAMYKVDSDGYVLVTYQYGDVGWTLNEKDPTGKSTTVVKSGGKYKDHMGGLVSSRNYSFSIENVKKGGIEVKSVYSTTYYDNKGNAIYTKDSNGVEVTRYHYKKNSEGSAILESVFDKTTGNTTYYDEDGNRDRTENANGGIVAKYYDRDGYSVHFNGDNSIEVVKYDVNGKELYRTSGKVLYKRDGTIDKVLNEKGEVLEKYKYTYITDNKGNKVKIIEYMESRDGSKTYYDKQGRQTYTENKDGEVTKRFHWQGDILVYVTDQKTGLQQWYNMNKELVWVTFNDRIICGNIYNDKGHLVGKWDAQKNEVTIFVNGKPWITVKLSQLSEYNKLAGSLSSLISRKAEIDSEIAKGGSSVTLNRLMEKFGLSSKTTVE